MWHHITSGLVFATFALYSATNDSLFVKTPESATVFLGASQTVVEFSCEMPAVLRSTLKVTDGSSGALVHEEEPGDIVYNDSTMIDQDGGLVRIRRVVIAVKVAYNGSNVLCQIESQNGTILESADALFLIQGPPGAVTDFRASAYVTHVLVTWGAPFTLDVTGVEHDITYSLTISNITNETEPVAVNCIIDTIYNYTLTCTEFAFSPPNTQLGQSFNFTVTPMNGAGTGPPSHTLTATLTDQLLASQTLTVSPLMNLPPPSHSLTSTLIKGPDVGPGENEPKNSEGNILRVVVLPVVVVLLLVMVVCLHVVCCCCVRRNNCEQCSKMTLSSSRVRGREEASYDILSPTTFTQTTGGINLPTIISSPASATAGEEGDGSPGEVRKRHKQGSQSPDDSPEK